MPAIAIATVQERELVPGFRVRFIHARNMTLAFWRAVDGAFLPLHEHPQEQITVVLSGRLELTVGNETHLLGPGGVVVIPPGVTHCGRALSDCELIDAFSPARGDHGGLA